MAGRLNGAIDSFIREDHQHAAGPLPPPAFAIPPSAAFAPPHTHAHTGRPMMRVDMMRAATDSGRVTPMMPHAPGRPLAAPPSAASEMVTMLKDFFSPGQQPPAPYTMGPGAQAVDGQLPGPPPAIGPFPSYIASPQESPALPPSSLSYQPPPVAYHQYPPYPQTGPPLSYYNVNATAMPGSPTVAPYGMPPQSAATYHAYYPAMNGGGGSPSVASGSSPQLVPGFQVHHHHPAAAAAAAAHGMAGMPPPPGTYPPV